MIERPSLLRDVANTVGVIVAGGAARRMGGGDKTLRQVGGAPILRRVVEAVGPQCKALVLSANGDPRRFEAFGLPVVADDVPGRPGPLAGVLAGLEWTALHHGSVEWLLSVPGDTPFLPADLVERLHARRADAKADVAYAASGKHIHPTVALWPTRARGKLRSALTEGGVRSVLQFARMFATTEVAWPDGAFDPFANVNEPGDLVAAEIVESRRA